MLMAFRRLSRELDAKTRELEATNAELDQFTYTVSHDLKSPLITIQGFAERVQKALAIGDTPGVERSVRYGSSAAKKMERLIDDLLELSRLGRFTNPPVKVALANVAAEAVELLAGRIQ